MTIYFMGGEMGSFLPSDSSAIENTDGTYFDSSFSRCSLDANTFAYNETALFTSLTTGYIHWQGGVEDYSVGTITAWEFLSSAGNVGIDIRRNWTANTLVLRYWNGSATLDAGSFTIEMAGTSHAFDLAFTVNSGSGSLTLYVAGTPRITATGLVLSAVPNIAYFRSGGGQFGPRTSQVIAANESTVGWRLGTIPMTGNGASTTWSGNVNDIDETVYSDADTITSTSNNEVELYTGTSIFNSTGYRIKAVGVSARARKSTTGPTQMALALRSAGTTYLSTTHSFASVGYEAHQAVWETNPATTAAFLFSELSALQFGVKSLSSTST